MKIEALQGVFDTFHEFSFENTLYSQMLNDSGNQSAPITLPATDNNLTLLDHIHRLDGRYKPMREVYVVVSHGVWSRQCRMVVHSANQTDGIDCTIYFDRGSFLAAVDGITMQELNLPVVSNPQSGAATEKENALYLVGLLKQQYLNPTDESHFCVAPLFTDETFKEYKSPRNADEAGEFPFILNGFNFKSDARMVGIWNTLEIFEAEFPRIFVMNDALIDAHEGYGMTPFLKLFYVLGKLFNRFGYVFDDNVLRNTVETDGYVVVLNNVADAVYSGTLNYNQLLPAVSIKEFLKTIETLFAGKFVYNDVNRTVEFVMYRDWLDDIDNDLTPYLAEPLKIVEYNFQKMDVKSDADKKSTNMPNTEYITLPIQSEGEKSITAGVYPIQGGERTVADFNIKSVVIDKVVRKNTDIEINGVVQPAAQSAGDKDPVRIARVKKTYETEDICHYVRVEGGRGVMELAPYLRIAYRRVYASPFTGTTEPVQFAKTMYSRYFEFREHSNMAVEAKMNMPFSVMMGINFQLANVIDGIPFMIDRVKFRLPFDNRQTVTLRTVKKYEDRRGIPPITLWRPEM